MIRNSELYVGYLEALALSAMTELERLGNRDIPGIDWEGNKTVYSIYNARRYINETRKLTKMSQLVPE